MNHNPLKNEKVTGGQPVTSDDQTDAGAFLSTRILPHFAPPGQPSVTSQLTAELARLESLYVATGDAIHLADWLRVYAERERVRRFGARAFDGGAG